MNYRPKNVIIPSNLEHGKITSIGKKVCMLSDNKYVIKNVSLEYVLKIYTITGIRTQDIHHHWNTYSRYTPSLEYVFKIYTMLRIPFQMINRISLSLLLVPIILKLKTSYDL